MSLTQAFSCRFGSLLANGADGISDIEGKAARVAVSEWSRGDASDIDGQNREVEMGGST